MLASRRRFHKGQLIIGDVQGTTLQGSSQGEVVNEGFDIGPISLWGSQETGDEMPAPRERREEKSNRTREEKENLIRVIERSNALLREAASELENFSGADLDVDSLRRDVQTTAVEEVLIIRKKFARFFGSRMFIRS